MKYIAVVFALFMACAPTQPVQQADSSFVPAVTPPGFDAGHGGATPHLDVK